VTLRLKGLSLRKKAESQLGGKIDSTLCLEHFDLLQLISGIFAPALHRALSYSDAGAFKLQAGAT
jgi:hypothetical protein